MPSSIPLTTQDKTAVCGTDFFNNYCRLELSQNESTSTTALLREMLQKVLICQRSVTCLKDMSEH